MEFDQEVFGEKEESLAPSVIRDMLDQLRDLSKRYMNIKVMMDTEPMIEPIPLREYDPEERSRRLFLLTVSQFTSKIKRILLKLKY